MRSAARSSLYVNVMLGDFLASPNNEKDPQHKVQEGGHDPY